MQCRRCNASITKVLERRGIRRRRECANCGPKHRFTTYEVYARPQTGPSHGWKMDPSKVNRGESCGHSYLTASNVYDIRRLYAEGWSHSQIARHFKMPKATVGDICRRKTWNHLPPQDFDFKRSPKPTNESIQH